MHIIFLISCLWLGLSQCLPNGPAGPASIWRVPDTDVAIRFDKLGQAHDAPLFEYGMNMIWDGLVEYNSTGKEYYFIPLGCFFQARNVPWRFSFVSEASVPGGNPDLGIRYHDMASVLKGVFRYMLEPPKRPTEGHVTILRQNPKTRDYERIGIFVISWSPSIAKTKRATTTLDDPMANCAQ